MAEKVNAKGQTLEQFLAAYKPGNYERPSVTVDMMVLAMNKCMNGMRILLIQRKNHPYIDCWALAGGFVDMKESAHEAAARELKEETGLSGIYLEQLYTMSKPDRDPRMRVIDIAYMALIQEQEAVAGDDAKDARWFDIEFTKDALVLRCEEVAAEIRYDLEYTHFRNGVVTICNPIPKLASEDALAFDHAEVILEGLLRLRNKIEYSDVAFNLVPEEFTLPDLQSVYETILGRSLYKTNFRSKITDRVEPIGQKGISITGKKKSELYRYRSTCRST